MIEEMFPFISGDHLKNFLDFKEYKSLKKI
jgi:hypothetical protein